MKKVTAYIALGSNLGDRADLIRQAVEMLTGSELVTLIDQSEVIETFPLGPSDQPPYLDCVVKIQTSLPPENLLNSMQNIEEALGRQRQRKWGPRTIDLDLLLYGDEVIETKRLTVPHKQMHLRSFVMHGISQLDGELIHPVIGVSMNELHDRLNGGNFFIDCDKPQLVSIAGLIGVGKTTLGKALARQFGCALLHEAYDTNPYLAQAYAGKDVALESQLYFLNSRYKQMSRDSLEPGNVVFSDYIFEKDRIFAERTLNSQQLQAYNQCSRQISPQIADEVLVIYLYDDPKVILERIHRRNRPYEQVIGLPWLAGLADEYNCLFDAWKACPVIALSTSTFDARRQEDVSWLAGQIEHYVCS